jgi:FAD binding domain
VRLHRSTRCGKGALFSGALGIVGLRFLRGHMPHIIVISTRIESGAYSCELRAPNWAACVTGHARLRPRTSHDSQLDIRKITWIARLTSASVGHAEQSGTSVLEQVMKINMQGVNVENQILITGAGPAGLALSAELSRRGLKPLLIDRQAAGANTSRACVVHARTMEVLEPLGVTQDLLTEGLKVHIFRIRDRDRPLLTIDFSNIPSQYRFTLMIPQNRVEQFLLQHLEGMGCRVMRPCELLRFASSARQMRRRRSTVPPGRVAYRL